MTDLALTGDAAWTQDQAFPVREYPEILASQLVEYPVVRFQQAGCRAGEHVYCEFVKACVTLLSGAYGDLHLRAAGFGRCADDAWYSNSIGLHCLQDPFCMIVFVILTSLSNG